MEYVQLNHSDLTVSRFCMGGCPMGGYQWGETNQQDFVRAIQTGLEAGVTFFDTADTYGLGQSEKTLAKGLGNHRKDVVIQTKFGVRAGNGKTVIDNSPAWIREALDHSLKRLNTDYIDLYVVHYWDRKTPAEEIIDELERQKAAGKIRYFGLSNVKPNELPQCVPHKGQFVTAQHEFSLCCRDKEGELRLLEAEMDTTPMTWGSLGQGMLTGKYKEGVTFPANDRRRREVYVNFHGDKLKRNLKIVETLKMIAAVHNVSCAATAIRFIMDYLPTAIPIMGMKNALQMQDNLRSLDWHLSPEEVSLLNRVSLEGEQESEEKGIWQKEF